MFLFRIPQDEIPGIHNPGAYKIPFQRGKSCVFDKNETQQLLKYE